jgi:hypothetical protein
MLSAGEDVMNCRWGAQRDQSINLKLIATRGTLVLSLHLAGVGINSNRSLIRPAPDAPVIHWVGFASG